MQRGREAQCSVPVSLHVLGLTEQKVGAERYVCARLILERMAVFDRRHGVLPLKASSVTLVLISVSGSVIVGEGQRPALNLDMPN